MCDFGTTKRKATRGGKEGDKKDSFPLQNGSVDDFNARPHHRCCNDTKDKGILLVTLRASFLPLAGGKNIVCCW